MKTAGEYFKYVAAIFMVTSMSVIAVAQQNCTLKKDAENIKVYSCETQDSDFKSVRAEFELNASIEEYRAIVLDVDHYKEWHYRTVNPRLLNIVSASELIYYTQVSAPWPVNNRDLILRLSLAQDSITKVLTVTLESIPDYLPEVEDVVRIPESYSVMTLTPVEESRLKVDYRIQVDPGGQIPPWLANMVSTQAPYQTFKNLMERLESKKNDKTVVTSIVN